MVIRARSGLKTLSLATLALATLGGTAVPGGAQSTKKVPYWASIAKDEARMRVGPSMDYPANWIYRRRNLPVKVIEVYPNWRKIEDPGGAQGWMHVRLLKDDKTAVIVGDTTPLRADPSDSASALYRAEPGVVGRTSNCDGHWCKFDVNGQRGYVEKSHLWGATDE
ncbi:MAG TPA: SH3 domain-containing protein [Sphingobium sp.]|uniref:SH3 domain-containing protein n=1 Tax=Sphingobium sp. TaxID=1912891 RepID=UPI002ED58C18